MRRARSLTALALVLALAGCVDTGTSVPAPDADQRRELAAQLAAATAASATSEGQRVCYGWRLTNGTSLVAQGSSLGDNVPAYSDENFCPRWVEVRASIDYAPESSESSDRAFIGVETSSGFEDAGSIRDGLTRFNLDEGAFIDDPAWAIARAAMTLPLLTAEAGGVRPAATPSATPAAAPSAIDPPGNDLWRDRWVFAAVAAGLVLFAGLLVIGGVRRLRRERRQGRPAAPRQVTRV